MNALSFKRKATPSEAALRPAAAALSLHHGRVTAASAAFDKVATQIRNLEAGPLAQAHAARDELARLRHERHEQRATALLAGQSTSTENFDRRIADLEGQLIAFDDSAESATLAHSRLVSQLDAMRPTISALHASELPLVLAVLKERLDAIAPAFRAAVTAATERQLDVATLVRAINRVAPKMPGGQGIRTVGDITEHSVSAPISPAFSGIAGFNDLRPTADARAGALLRELGAN